jgi:hypothetical protein
MQENLEIFLVTTSKVRFIFGCSKNWQKKSAGNHLFSKGLPAHFFCQFLLQ